MARKAGVTREQVIDAAETIADRDGLEAVSLARVATTVGVQPPSLYAHVEGLGGLRRALTRRAVDRLTESFLVARSENEDPRAALHAIAHAYRAFALAHPGLYAALLPVPRPDTDPDGAAAAARPVQVIAEVLAALGIDDTRHIDLIRTLRAVLHGFVDLELGGGFGMDQPVGASFDAAVELVLGAFDTTARTASPS